jgi:CheY-like chemotaxis protein
VRQRMFIVDDEPVLLKTRSYLLEDWETTTANTREAEEAKKQEHTIC